MFAGTPTGQAIINDVIPSINPATSPSYNYHGVLGYGIGEALGVE